MKYSMNNPGFSLCDALLLVWQTDFTRWNNAEWRMIQIGQAEHNLTTVQKDLFQGTRVM